MFKASFNYWTLAILSFFVCCGLIHAQNNEGVMKPASTQQKIYTKKGNVELLGSASFSYFATRFSSDRAVLSMAAGINYFISNNWFVGIAPGLLYSKNMNQGQSYWSLSLTPAVDFGYATLLTERWYGFIAASYGPQFYGSDSQNGTKFEGHRIEIMPGVKYDTGGGLINVGLAYSSFFTPEYYSYSTFALSLGYSVFF